MHACMHTHMQVRIHTHTHTNTKRQHTHTQTHTHTYAHIQLLESLLMIEYMNKLQPSAKVYLAAECVHMYVCVCVCVCVCRHVTKKCIKGDAKRRCNTAWKLRKCGSISIICRLCMVALSTVPQQKHFSASNRSSSVGCWLMHFFLAMQSRKRLAHETVDTCASHEIVDTCASHEIVDTCASHEIVDTCASHETVDTCASHEIVDTCASHEIVDTCASHEIVDTCASHACPVQDITGRLPGTHTHRDKFFWTFNCQESTQKGVN